MTGHTFYLCKASVTSTIKKTWWKKSYIHLLKKTTNHWLRKSSWFWSGINLSDFTKRDMQKSFSIEYCLNREDIKSESNPDQKLQVVVKRGCISMRVWDNTDDSFIRLQFVSGFIMLIIILTHHETLICAIMKNYTTETLAELCGFSKDGDCDDYPWESRFIDRFVSFVGQLEYCFEVPLDWNIKLKCLKHDAVPVK